MTFALALHGGAGATRNLDYLSIIDHMTGLVEAARDKLTLGASALDVAIDTVAEMETSGLYVAGRGGSPNLSGGYELDASVMDGQTGRAGAVAALQGYQNPIQVARLVMEQTPHVLLAGDGAAAFAAEHGCARIPAGRWFTHAGAGESNFAPKPWPISTVGCAVLDIDGRLAAATSSGGVFSKMPGRIGDSPIIGAGTWADDRVSVSCTGSGELFLRQAAAAKIAWRVAGGQSLQDAATATLAEIAAAGGEGGVAAVSRDGCVALPFNAEGMKRAWLTGQGQIGATVFE